MAIIVSLAMWYVTARFMVQDLPVCVVGRADGTRGSSVSPCSVTKRTNTETSLLISHIEKELKRDLRKHTSAKVV